MLKWLLLALLAWPNLAQAQTFKTCDGTASTVRYTPRVTGYPASLACWFRPTSIAAAGAVCGFYAGANNNNKMNLVIQTSGVVNLNAGDSTAVSSTPTINTVNLNTWNLIVGTWTDATNRRAVLNGDFANAAVVVAGTSRVMANINRYSLCSADNGATKTAFLVGEQGPAAVWNVIVTDGDITSMWRGRPFTQVQRLNLKHYTPYSALGDTADGFGEWLNSTPAFLGTYATSTVPGPPIRHP